MAVQSDPASADSSCSCCRWIPCLARVRIWCCPQPLALSPLIPLLRSPLPTRLNACLVIKPLVSSIYSYSFPTCRVDVACLHISFANIFETKGRPSGRPSSSGKLAVEYVPRNCPVLHTADMAKPASQPSLTEQGEHARYPCLCQDILNVWGMVLLDDAQNLSKAAQVEGVG